MGIIADILGLGLTAYNTWASNIEEREQAALDITAGGRAQALNRTQMQGLTDSFFIDQRELTAQIGDIASTMALTREGARADLGFLGAQRDYTLGQIGIQRSGLAAEADYTRASSGAQIAEIGRQAGYQTTQIAEAGAEGVATGRAGAAASGLAGGGSVLALARRTMDVAGREIANVRAGAAYQTEDVRRQSNFRLGEIARAGQGLDLQEGMAGTEYAYRAGGVARGLAGAEIQAAGQTRGLNADITQGRFQYGVQAAGLTMDYQNTADELSYLTDTLGFSADYKASDFANYALGRPRRPGSIWGSYPSQRGA